MSEAKKLAKQLAEWHDRLDAMIDQVGHPDYSLRELVEGLRQMRDEMFATRAPERKRKLSVDQDRRIRRGNLSDTELARLYGVKESTIRLIKNRRKS